MTSQELESAFEVYLPQLETVRSSKAYWPVLHVVLALPDICASLQAADGRTSADLYMDWCKAYVASVELHEADWYRMRCAVLHNGSAKPDPVTRRPSQYGAFRFVDPHVTGWVPQWHKHVEAEAGGLPWITLDISLLADEMVDAMRVWFERTAQNPTLLSVVIQNLPSLVRIRAATATLPIHIEPGGRVINVQKRTISTS